MILKKDAIWEGGSSAAVWDWEYEAMIRCREMTYVGLITSTACSLFSSIHD